MSTAQLLYACIGKCMLFCVCVNLSIVNIFYVVTVTSNVMMGVRVINQRHMLELIRLHIVVSEIAQLLMSSIW